MHLLLLLVAYALCTAVCIIVVLFDLKLNFYGFNGEFAAGWVAGVLVVAFLLLLLRITNK